MNDAMMKYSFTLLLGACFVLQFSDSLPQERPIREAADVTTSLPEDFNSTQLSKSATTITDAHDLNKIEASTTTKSTQIQQPNETESSEEIFYLPAMYDTPTFRLQLSLFKPIQEHTNTLVREGHVFLEESLKFLTTLPNKSANFEAYATRMSELLKRIEKIDLNHNSGAAIDEKSEIIDQLTDLYLDFAKILRNHEPREDALVLVQLSKKTDLHSQNARIRESLAKSVERLTKSVHKFFVRIDKEQKQKYEKLIEWYEDFKTLKDDQEKFDDTVILLKYLLLHRSL